MRGTVTRETLGPHGHLALHLLATRRFHALLFGFSLCEVHPDGYKPGVSNRRGPKFSALDSCGTKKRACLFVPAPCSVAFLLVWRTGVLTRRLHQPARKLKLFLNQSVGECIPRAAHCFHSNHSQWQQHEWQHGERRPRSQRRICPAFLHFPGGQKSHISGVRRALDAGRGACRAKGSLTVVNVQTGHLQMRRGTSAQRCDPEWVGKVVEERWVASLAKSLLTVGLT